MHGVSALIKEVPRSSRAQRASGDPRGRGLSGPGRQGHFNATLRSFEVFSLWAVEDLKICRALKESGSCI